MLAEIPKVCYVTYGQLKNSQYDEQVERVPFSLTHDAPALQNWNDGGR
jgi:hypothetical protein